MFGHRSDGRKLKTLPPFFRVIPSVMLERSDSQVYFKQDISLKTIDEYIDKKAAEGIKFSYMNIIYAALIRILAERPQLNRFAMNGTLYARNQILVSLAIKKIFLMMVLKLLLSCLLQELKTFLKLKKSLTKLLKLIKILVPPTVLTALQKL